MYQALNPKPKVIEQPNQSSQKNVAIIGINRIGLYVFNNSKTYLRRNEKILGFINENTTADHSQRLSGLNHVITTVLEPQKNERGQVLDALICCK